MTSAHRPENLTWEISAMGHGWREGRAAERSVLRGWLDGVEFGRSFQVRGRSRALGERERTIDGRELGGDLVEYRRSTMAVFLLVGGGSHRPVTIRHENGQVDDLPPRFAVEADMALDALATFVACGLRGIDLA